MATNFPASLDSLTNPTSSDSLNSPSHSAQHANVNDAVEALQAKVGADSSAVTSSLDYKVAQLEAGATGGKILQVVSTTKSDTFSTTSTSLTNITGLSVSITPTSSSSKVFVMLTIGQVDSSNTATYVFDVTRGGTPVGVGDAASNRTRGAASGAIDPINRGHSVVWSYLDSPATTSATTYQARCQIGLATLYLNRSQNDSDAAVYGRTVSTITAVEVSA